MDDGRGQWFRQGGGQSRPHFAHEGEVAGGIYLPELPEALYLAFQIAPGPDEARQVRSVHIYCVDLYQRVDQVFGQPLPGSLVVVQARRQLVGHYEPLDVVGDVKRHPQEGVVLAHGPDAGHAYAHPGEGQLQTGLAHDVVRGWWERRPRWPAEHVPLPVPLYQEREIRTSAFTHARGDDGAGTETLVVQKGGYALQDEQGWPRQPGRLVRGLDDIRSHGAGHQVFRRTSSGHRLRIP